MNLLSVYAQADNVTVIKTGTLNVTVPDPCLSLIVSDLIICYLFEPLLLDEEGS